MIIIDVREKSEFNIERIKDSINIPFSHFKQTAAEIINNLKDNEIILMCQSGLHAKLALSEIKKFHMTDKVFKIYDGGINGWKAASKEVIYGSTAKLPIMRQMQLGAGLLILSFFALSYFINPNFIYGTLFIGIGLTIAGVTCFCSMIVILQKMPWNKV